MTGALVAFAIVMVIIGSAVPVAILEDREARGTRAVAARTIARGVLDWHTFHCAACGDRGPCRECRAALAESR